MDAKDESQIERQELFVTRFIARACCVPPVYGRRWPTVRMENQIELNNSLSKKQLGCGGQAAD
jgi:hypothetical protein